MNDKRIWRLSAGLLFVVACAEGSSFDPTASSSSGKGGGGEANGSSSSGDGGNNTAGAGGTGTGGMATSSGGNGGGGGGAASSSSSSSGSSSSSSSSSSSGATCPGVIVDWNWNTGTGPTNLTFGGNTWRIGTSNSVGPKDGLAYLATNPDGYYADSVDDWVKLPTIDLSPFQSCKFRTTVSIWRNAEQGNLGGLYDGGNIQYTTDPAGMTGWKILDNADMTMAYDYMLSACGNGCIVKDQWTWTSSQNPKWRLGTLEEPVMPGTSITFRFTFHSDSYNSNGPLPGLYAKSVLVEAF